MLRESGRYERTLFGQYPTTEFIASAAFVWIIVDYIRAGACAIGYGPKLNVLGSDF
jgi:hypothetical protein